MTTLLLTIALFILVMLAMAVGVMVAGRRLRGSCGGVGGSGCQCRAEGIDQSLCERPEPGAQSSAS